MTTLLLTSYEKYGTVGIDDYKEMFIDECLDVDEICIYDYNEYLLNNGYETYFSVDELDEVLAGFTPWEVARAFHFGGANPCDDFFQFNGYGNLESFDEWQIRKEMKSDKDFLLWYIEENNLIDEDEAQAIIDESNELIRKGY